MTRVWLSSLLFGAALAVGAPALAQQGKKKDTAAAATAPDADGVRRDPNGVKGISPLWEAFGKGDAAYIARDFDAAIAAYTEAIRVAPQNPLGHYRKGQALVAKGALEDAMRSYTDALRFSQGSSALRAKILLVIADVRERQRALEDAQDSWTKYEEFVTSDATAKGYPATAAERKKRIKVIVKLNADSAAVRERIEKRAQQAGK